MDLSRQSDVYAFQYYDSLDPQCVVKHGISTWVKISRDFSPLLESVCNLIIALNNDSHWKHQSVAYFSLQDKTVPIPEKLNEWAPRPPPEFVRDVMGKLWGVFQVVSWVLLFTFREKEEKQEF